MLSTLCVVNDFKKSVTKFARNANIVQPLIQNLLELQRNTLSSVAVYNLVNPYDYEVHHSIIEINEATG